MTSLRTAIVTAALLPLLLVLLLAVPSQASTPPSPSSNVTETIREGLPASVGLGDGHAVLTCSACHDANRPWLLVAGGMVGAWNATLACKLCHPREFRDYQLGVHGGIDVFCLDGSEELHLVNGTRFKLHICKSMMSAPRQCFSCHDPHFPRFEASKPLPGWSKAARPPQEPLALSTLAVALSSLSLLLLAVVIGCGRR